jgi:hypothetical protein
VKKTLVIIDLNGLLMLFTGENAVDLQPKKHNSVYKDPSSNRPNDTLMLFTQENAVDLH